MHLREDYHHRISSLEAQLAEARATCKGLLDYAPGEVCYQRYIDLHGGKCKCLHCTGNREAIETIRRARALVERKSAGLDQPTEAPHA